MMLDIIKGLMALVAYLIVAPMLGKFIRKDRARQRWTFSLLVFATSWHINKITFMIGSIEWYRGATKGFEFSILDVLAIALLISGRNKIGRWFAPGAGLYLLYVAMSWLSIFAAPEPSYVCMAGVRFIKAVLVYLAACHFLREEEDLHVLLRAMAFTLIVQALAVLKMKYVNHIYQVNGWFEHQNALAMWAYMCGLPLLAAAMSHLVPQKQARLYCYGFMASGIVVQSSLSRASLVFFAIGSAIILLVSLCQKVTLRKVTFILSLACIGGLGLAFTWDTISARFGEDRNKESSELRVLLVNASKEMLADSAIGQGWNNYALVINKPWRYGDGIDQWTIDRGYTVSRRSEAATRKPLLAPPRRERLPRLLHLYVIPRSDYVVGVPRHHRHMGDDLEHFPFRSNSRARHPVLPQPARTRAHTDEEPLHVAHPARIHRAHRSLAEACEEGAALACGRGGAAVSSSRARGLGMRPSVCLAVRGRGGCAGSSSGGRGNDTAASGNAARRGRAGCQSCA